MSGVHASTPAALDTTAPAAPTGFAAVVAGSDVSLSWPNPTDPDFDKIVIRRKQGSPPTSITDGSAVFTSTIGTSDMRAPFTSAQYAGNQQFRYPRDRGLFRFVAEKSQVLDNFIFSGKIHASETGYAGSPNGGVDTGRCHAELYLTDTDGGPTGAALATAEFYIRDQEPLTIPFRSALDLEFGVSLTAGTAYVVLLWNNDPRNCDAGATNSLSAGIDGVTATIPLTAARAEYVNGGTISINAVELCIIVSGGGTTSLTVTRGSYGTSAVAHLSGVNVQGSAPFYFSTNSLYYAIPFPDPGPDYRGSQGALYRNQVAAGATDNYYGFDGRTNYGGTHDSRVTWYIPSNAGNPSANRHYVPTYTCVWADGTVSGQPYYSGHRLPAGQYGIHFKNITADWTITQVGAFCPNDSEFSQNATTPVLVYVNDVLVDTITLGGQQGFLRNWLTAPITLHAGDVLELRSTCDPTGAAGLQLHSLYAGYYITAFWDLGDNATFPYHADAADLDANDPGQGGAERAITLFPMPDRGHTPVIHESTTTDPGSAGWAYSAFAVDTAGNVSAPAVLGTTVTLVGTNLTASPGWATPGWFSLGGIGAIATGSVSAAFTFNVSTSGIAVDPIDEGDFYATVSELARILKIRDPSEEQELAMLRVLETSSFEIDSELDREDGPYTAPFPSLVVQVCLERATEHWRQQESPFGLVAVGVDLPAERAGADSWNRHALKLAPLKSRWGMA